VKHEFTGAAGPGITEEHDIVYRDRRPSRRRPAELQAGAHRPRLWSRQIVPDDVLLFRYSALTFNGHRIHYDRRYVTEVEGYPGLIVHGPLIATLLVDLLRRNMPGAHIGTIDFKAVQAHVFDLHPFASTAGQSAGGKTVKLWARDRWAG
jgi:3-methylfumaryl-CoA hydratase